MLIFGILFVQIVLSDFKRSVREEMETGNRITIQLIENFLVNSLQEKQNLRSKLINFLNATGRIRANDIKVFDENNFIIYESPKSNYKAGRYAPDWYSNLVTPKIDQVRLNFLNLTIFITPESSRSVLDSWDELKLLVKVFFIFYLILTVSLFWLLGKWLRPIKTITETMTKVNEKGFDIKLPDFVIPDFQKISTGFNAMTNQLESLVKDHEVLGLITYQSSEAIIMIDNDMKITFWNYSAEKLFSVKKNDAMESKITDLIKSFSQIKFDNDLNDMSSINQVHIYKENGKNLELSISTSSLIDPNSEIKIGQVLLIRDITEINLRKQAELELNNRKKFGNIVQNKIEDERREISRELHDELGQCITAIKTISQAIIESTETSKENKEINLLKKIHDIASGMYDSVHIIIKRLRPPALDHLGLIDAIDSLIDQWSIANPHVEVIKDFPNHIIDLSEKVNIVIYRAVQECLTNIVKHSTASKVVIKISSNKKLLNLIIENNNSKYEKQKNQENFSNSSGFGILGLGERVESINGKILIKSDRNKYILSVQIPINQI
jgi:PAS domain S-box-containing protein